jgi:hypothetical protein
MEILGGRLRRSREHRAEVHPTRLDRSPAVLTG